MVKVLKTNSGFFIAFKDDASLSYMEVLQYKKSDFAKDKQDFQKKFPKADFTLTEMLQKELPNTLKQQEYFNQLSENDDLINDVYNLEDQTQKRAWFPKYTISQKDLPPPFNKQNTPIKRVVSFYYPEYDEQKQEVVCYNQNHDQVNISDFNGCHFKNLISIYDKVFMLPKDFIDCVRKKDHSSKGKKILFFLSDIISRYLTEDEKFYMLCHEMKHAQTYLYRQNLVKKEGYPELSPWQNHCFNEDNEKSAYMQEIFTLCASYFQKGEDIKVFTDRYYWLKDKIKDLTPEQRKQVLTDTNFIVNESIRFWDERVSLGYKEKINGKNHLERLTLNQAEQISVLNIDTSNTTYLKCKENMFTFEIYNPDKKVYETTNVLPLIKNPTQLKKENAETIIEAENIIRRRQSELQKEGITKELISSLINGRYKNPFKYSSLFFSKLLKTNKEK